MNGVRALNPGIVQLLGKELGPAIAEVRRRRKCSREKLAELAGVSPKAVEHWEMGRRIIRGKGQRCRKCSLQKE